MDPSTFPKVTLKPTSHTDSSSYVTQPQSKPSTDPELTADVTTQPQDRGTTLIILNTHEDANTGQGNQEEPHYYDTDATTVRDLTSLTPTLDEVVTTPTLIEQTPLGLDQNPTKTKEFQATVGEVIFSTDRSTSNNDATTADDNVPGTLSTAFVTEVNTFGNEGTTDKPNLLKQDNDVTNSSSPVTMSSQVEPEETTMYPVTADSSDKHTGTADSEVTASFIVSTEHIESTDTPIINNETSSDTLTVLETGTMITSGQRVVGSLTDNVTTAVPTANHTEGTYTTDANDTEPIGVTDPEKIINTSGDINATYDIPTTPSSLIQNSSSSEVIYILDDLSTAGGVTSITTSSDMSTTSSDIDNQTSIGEMISSANYTINETETVSAGTTIQWSGITEVENTTSWLDEGITESPDNLNISTPLPTLSATHVTSDPSETVTVLFNISSTDSTTLGDTNTTEGYSSVHTFHTVNDTITLDVTDKSVNSSTFQLSTTPQEIMTNLSTALPVFSTESDTSEAESKGETTQPTLAKDTTDSYVTNQSVPMTTSLSDTTKRTSDSTYEIRFDGNCSIVKKNPSLRKQFEENLGLEISERFGIERERISMGGIRCGSLYVTVVVQDSDSNTDQHIKSSIEADPLIVTLLFEDNSTMELSAQTMEVKNPSEDATPLVTDPPMEIIEDDDTFEKITLPILCTVGALAFIFIIFFLIFCIRRCCARRRSKRGFNLSTIPSSNVDLKDFTLTKMDRPYPAYNDKGPNLNSDYSERDTLPSSRPMSTVITRDYTRPFVDTPPPPTKHTTHVAESVAPLIAGDEMGADTQDEGHLPHSSSSGTPVHRYAPMHQSPLSLHSRGGYDNPSFSSDDILNSEHASDSEVPDLIHDVPADADPRTLLQSQHQDVVNGRGQRSPLLTSRESSNVKDDDREAATLF